MSFKIGTSIAPSILSGSRSSNGNVLALGLQRNHRPSIKLGSRNHFIAIMPSSSASPTQSSDVTGQSELKGLLHSTGTERARGTLSMISSKYSTLPNKGMVDAAAAAADASVVGSGNATRTRESVVQTRSGRSGDGMKRFELSPIPTENPLGQEGWCIRTAAALVIGDEILNGKTMDKNSNYFAKYCFERGIDLKRVEVIPDSENEIIEASRRLVSKYDFVITTGGIGPTHDDITYASLARAFNQSLVHHPETLRRLDEMNRHRAWVSTQTPQQREATKRMAQFPESAEVLFVCGDIWVPVVRLKGKLCIFPGIPMLFTKMLDGLAPYLPLPPASERPLRVQIFTERPESMIAPYLTALHARLKRQKADIQVGSYPVLGKGVFVSLIGRDRNMGIPSNHEQRIESDAQSTEAKEPLARVWLAQIASEVEKEIDGRIVSDEEVKVLKESGVGEVRRRMEDGERSTRSTEGSDRLHTSTSGSSSFDTSPPPPRASSPASVSACDSASVAEPDVEVTVNVEIKKPKLGEVGWS
ncbi:MoaB/Mog domain-containing protein [Lentinula aff. detonsa]|uniref:MoaB/Mog domain-containing protein n=1 Tax=Lentinula aff. detonsa TaxID=2804958 RepID=A0AA38KMG7_9AGAR|nr:MoaB/Mog domain-containing protein [Lentinula aff. detonsa]